MTQMLDSEIRKEVDPRDLILLTRDEARYVAKCLAAKVHGRNRKAEEYAKAHEQDRLFEHVWHGAVEIAARI